MESVVKARRYGKAQTAREWRVTPSPLACGWEVQLSHTHPCFSRKLLVSHPSGCFSSSLPGHDTLTQKTASPCSPSFCLTQVLCSISVAILSAMQPYNLTFWKLTCPRPATLPRLS